MKNSYFFSFKKESKGGDEMKSNFQGFNAVSLPGDEAPPECIYCKKYESENDEEDIKVNGEWAHFSAEFCRLDKIFESCQVGKKTDLEKGQISEKHLRTLLEQREKALQLSTPFNPIDLF